MERDGREIHQFSLSAEESGGVFKTLVQFMRGGVEDVPQPTRPPKERLLDYERDFDALYAAFLQSYGVDLFAEDNGKPLAQTMHWWRFMALANNLSAGSTLVDYYMHCACVSMAGDCSRNRHGNFMLNLP